jgi:acetyl-CoA acetyltransferase
MNPSDLRGKAAIVGFGDAYSDVGQKKSAFRLAMEALRNAVADCGIDKNDIDGVLVGRAPVTDSRQQWNNIFCAYAKLTPQFGTEVSIHAAGMNSMLKHAAMAVNAGIARFVLCIGVDTNEFTDVRAHVADIDTDPEFEAPYGPMIPSIYAQVACRLMHEYGVTEQDLAAVSVECQNWAVHHPKAAKRDKGRISVDDVLNSRLISWPLRLWNCAIWGPPGTAGAMIVTSAENARAIHSKPVYILGSAECETHEYITDRLALRRSSLPLGPLPSITSTGCRVAGKTAFDMAGVTHRDIDVIQTGSNFSHSELIALSELGFTTLPEAGDFIRSGATGVDGEFPTNTNGGWLSFGQPGAVCVMDSVVEAVRQLRGIALGKQVQNAEVACVHALGGMMACQSVTILSTST